MQVKNDKVCRSPVEENAFCEIFSELRLTNANKAGTLAHLLLILQNEGKWIKGGESH